VTEILYGVGAFARVIAVSDYDTFPPEAEKLPHIGGWQNINLEQLAALKIDLLLMTDAEAPLVKDRIEALGIKTLVVPSRTVEDAFKAIEQIGQAVGEEANAQKLIAETRAELDDVRTRTRALNRPRVLCVVDRAPGTLRDIYTATRGSFLAQIIEIAGGESIAPPAAQGYGKISKEAIVALNPDIIIDMVQGQEGRFAENPQDVWRELAQARAVREGRVYPIRDTSVLHPSQFVGQTARKFAAIIHPEIFKAQP
jgi:iron complex transport system substrate-binding protein